MIPQLWYRDHQSLKGPGKVDYGTGRGRFQKPHTYLVLGSCHCPASASRGGILFVVLMVLGVKLRTSQRRDKYFTSETHAQSPWCSVQIP